MASEWALSHREYRIVRSFVVFGLLKLEEYPHRLTCLKQLKPQARHRCCGQRNRQEMVQKFHIIICPLRQIRPPPYAMLPLLGSLRPEWGKDRTIVTTGMVGGMLGMGGMGGLGGLGGTVWLTLSRVFPGGPVLDPEFLGGGQEGLPELAESCHEAVQGSCIVLED
jgi:hypothetical protein